MKKMVVEFYENLFGRPGNQALPDVMRLEHFSTKSLSEDQCSLLKEVTEEQIKAVVFKMPNNKAPRPDGFVAEFFKKIGKLLRWMWLQLSNSLIRNICITQRIILCLNWFLRFQMLR